MTNPNEAPQPQQPGQEPPQPGNVPPAGYQPPPGQDQAGYGVPSGPNNAPPSGLGYPAPPRNSFGLNFNNIAQRLTDTSGVPQKLVISYWLWVAAAALGIVTGVLNIFVYTGALGGLMLGASITGLIIGLVFAAFYVFCAIRLKEGASWARIVLTILGALAVIGLISQIATGNLNLIGSAVATAAAILMWLPESQAHFKN